MGGWVANKKIKYLSSCNKPIFRNGGPGGWVATKQSRFSNLPVFLNGGLGGCVDGNRESKTPDVFLTCQCSEMVE